MHITRYFAGAAVFLILCGSASADLIKDPDMSMDAGSFSTGLSQFVSFTPDQAPGTGGGILDLFNDTGKLLTSFSLTTFIEPGLTDPLSSFFCSAGPNPFFLNCGYQYFQSNGELIMTFSGVNPSDGDETTSGEIGEQEGIPPLAPGCNDSNADTEMCAGQGHFAISFNNDFSFSGDVGGWSPTASPGLFTTAPTFVLTTPEPSGLSLLATAIVIISGIRWKANRRQRGRSLAKGR